MRSSPEKMQLESVHAGWKTLPLEDCMQVIIDYRGKSPSKKSFGIPLVTAKIVKGGRIMNPEEFIAEADFDDWMRRGMPQAGDVVMTTEAPLGEVAQLDGRKVALAQRLITLRGKPDLLDNTFLKFLLQSNQVQEELRSRGTGTTVVGIRQSELRKVKLTLPPLPEQRRIAKILGDLDDKIEINRKMNETLEQMARALFKSWFVDFDPVRAKMESRTPTGMDAATAALFPNRLIDSELGPIPEGWEVKALGEVAVNPRRSINPSEFSIDTAYIGLEHIPKRSIALAEWTSAESVASGKSQFRRGEILFGKLRPYFHKVGVAPIDGVCSTDILVIGPKSSEWFGFVLGHVSSDELVQFADQASTGTRMPRASWSDIESYKAVIPDSSLASKYNEFLKLIINQITSNIHQSHTLSTLRDTLLPKLVGGEVRVGSDHLGAS